MTDLLEGAEKLIIDRWVRSRLETYGAPPEAIYDRFAPHGTPYPYVIFQPQTPPRDIRGLGTARIMVESLYIVKAVAQVETDEPLVPLAKLVDAALTLEGGDNPIYGWVFTSIREEQFSLVEVDDGKQYRHLGGQYRIQAQARQPQ